VALDAERWVGETLSVWQVSIMLGKWGLPWRFGLFAVMQFDSVGGAVPG
jgi:hypothetical protein